MRNKNMVTEPCSDICILKKYGKRMKDFELGFSGASKKCTVGIKIDDSFIVEK